LLNEPARRADRNPISRLLLHEHPDALEPHLRLEIGGKLFFLLMTILASLTYGKKSTSRLPLNTIQVFWADELDTTTSTYITENWPESPQIHLGDEWPSRLVGGEHLCNTIPMETQPTVRQTFKYKLLPTPEQEQTMLFVLRRCRELYNAALQERRDAWQKCHKSVTCAHQSTELPGIKEVRPEYHDIHSQMLQDVLTRLDRAFQAFFRRVESGEEPGYPRFQGTSRYTSFTYKQFGNGAVLENGSLVLSKIGRIAVRWSRPLVGTVKTVTLTKEADGWYCCLSCEGIAIQPLPLTGQETGIDVGLKVFLVTAIGDSIENPRHYRKAERELKKAQRRVSRRKKGSKRRKKAVQILARKHQKVKRQRRDFHHKTALALLRHYDTIYLEDLQVANMVKNSHLSKSISATLGGRSSAPSSKAKQHTLAVESSPCHRPIPARSVVAVGRSFVRA
jgi:putative transposase